MPITPTYPGVYIEEIPSGVRTITGVATSITAFIGRALRGPVSEPTIINNFGEFESRFGGLWLDGPMSYAVRDFYQNGGSQAIIVRLFNDPADNKALLKLPVAAAGTDSATELILESANPGKWSNNLEVAVNYDGITQDVADRYDLQETDLFNLVVTDASVEPETVETISNLSVIEGPRRLNRVLKEESLLVRLNGDLPPNRPDETKDEQGNPITIKVQDDDRVEDSDSLGEDDYKGSRNDKTGLYALEKADLFNLLCIPPDIRDDDTELGVYTEALTYCVERRAMLIVDPPIAWGKIKETAAQTAKNNFSNFVSNISANNPKGRNAAIYFPRVVQADPLRENQLDTFVACGAIAGIMASTDVQRGVWKAPAGIDAGISGIRGLQVNLNDNENGLLNPLGINCLRNFPVYGRVVWGARTLRGADQLADEYKYLPVRRLLLEFRLNSSPFPLSCKTKPFSFALWRRGFFE